MLAARRAAGSISVLGLCVKPAGRPRSLDGSARNDMTYVLVQERGISCSVRPAQRRGIITSTTNQHQNIISFVLSFHLHSTCQQIHIFPSSAFGAFSTSINTSISIKSSSQRASTTFHLLQIPSSRSARRRHTIPPLDQSKCWEIRELWEPHSSSLDMRKPHPWSP